MVLGALVVLIWLLRSQKMKTVKIPAGGANLGKDPIVTVTVPDNEFEESGTWTSAPPSWDPLFWRKQT